MGGDTMTLARDICAALTIVGACIIFFYLL
jgi:hypothetical protein